MGLWTAGTIERRADSRRIGRGLRLALLTCFALLALPAVAQAANVTLSNGTLTYDAGAGETYTAVIVKQQTTAVATIYFVGDQNPNVTVTATPTGAPGCVATPPALGLPKGYLCTVLNVTPLTSLVENLGDGNDTGVISSAAAGPAGTINGGTGNDTLVGGRENDTFHGAGGTDNVAYVGISAASITRTAPVTATLPSGSSPTTGNGQAGENDSIAADVEDLTGGNGNDTLTGNSGPNTIAGSAPPGTPDVDPQPAGTESRDTISGAGGDDSLLAGDSGTVAGQAGNDTVVGGRSFANVTTVNGGADDDTLVSGLGSDNLSGGAGSNTLAYVSVSQGGISIVNRNRGVVVQLPEPGATGTGGAANSQEHDIVHDDLKTLIGSNNGDFLVGSNTADTMLGAAPVGTGSGVVDSPAGNDTIVGRGGADSIVGGDRGQLSGGGDNDTIVGGRSTAGSDKTVIHGDAGDDTIVSGLGNDDIFGDAGSNTLAYVSVSQSGIPIVNRGGGVFVRLPEPGATGTGGALGGQETDIVHDDLHTVIGSNGGDFMVGTEGADTMLGAAPVGTGSGVVDTPAGNDTIVARGGDDTIVGGDRGQLYAGDGADTIVGGRSTAGADKTVIHGDPGNDTIVSGLGNDEIFGDAGANTLAYASVQQQGIDIVDRGTAGVTAVLPNAGQTATGGKTGGPEKDIIHSDIGTLVGGNGNDVLVGNNLANTIVGVAPAGTAGVKPGPAGNDVLAGLAGADLLLGAEGNDWAVGGPDNDVLLPAGGNDLLVGNAGVDAFNAGDGNDTNLSRDGIAEAILCGAGTDSVTGDTTDTTPAGDCETVSSG
jgi:Ca2+-binding RTX toxin-like protein